MNLSVLRSAGNPVASRYWTINLNHRARLEQAAYAAGFTAIV